MSCWPRGWVSAAASADGCHCFGEDIERRIDGCTALIEQRDQSVADLSYAYAMRALAYSLKGSYSTAIRDYDMAIGIQPDFAVALNNRAWAYFRWGKAATGLPDVERSLQLSPTSPHTLDTRAHIRQALGDPVGALSDYDRAMWYGGARMIKLYQCGYRGAALRGRDRRHLAAGADRGAAEMRTRQGLRSAPRRRAMSRGDELGS